MKVTVISLSPEDLEKSEGKKTTTNDESVKPTVENKEEKYLFSYEGKKFGKVGGLNFLIIDDDDE